MPSGHRLDWNRGHNSQAKGLRECVDCGPRPAARFLEIKGSFSLRCLDCLQKREDYRKKYLMRQAKKYDDE